MLTVVFILPDLAYTFPVGLPADRDGWRGLLGGPIDIIDCRGTAAPCAIVCHVQTVRMANGVPNEMVSALAGEPVFGPAVIVAGTSAINMLDDQFEGWEGDDAPRLPIDRGAP